VYNEFTKKNTTSRSIEKYHISFCTATAVSRKKKKKIKGVHFL